MNAENRYLGILEVLAFHEDLLSLFGGQSGMKDVSQLESVLAHVQNDSYYPDILEKSVHLFHSIIAFHCFSDGNTGTAIYATYTFLLRNGVVIEDFLIKSEDIAIGVASNDLSKDDIRRIFRAMLRSF